MELNLEEQVKKLKEENELLKQRLSNYTNPSCNKIYYEKNKDVINEKNKERAKIHYQQNKEIIRQKQKEYYEKTKKQKF
jgi:hypothetical protein